MELDKEHRRDAEENRRRYIYELDSIPSDIRRFHKQIKKLTRTERFMSAFLQSCIRYGYVKSYRSQQVIKLGTADQYIIADFFLHWPEVIIEVDGPEHQKAKDRVRDSEVKRLFGYTTIRIKNREVTRNNSAARTRLIKELAKAEGLSAKKVRERVKEYWLRQEEEGFTSDDDQCANL
jgi:very-short-patch-repair endonuclease